MPFTRTLAPILHVLGIKLVHNASISKQITEGYQFLTLAKQKELKEKAKIEQMYSPQLSKKRKKS
jgi:hypothetical protein